MSYNPYSRELGQKVKMQLAQQMQLQKQVRKEKLSASNTS
jgi:hypothetical protein